MQVRRCSLVFSCLACALVIVAGCRRTPPPATIIELDSGPVPDTMIPPNLDSDGDGLCDFSEIQRRTDPNNVDTDGDGFSDYVEAQNGTGANDITSPERSIMVTLPEDPTGHVDFTVPFSVRGVGESMSGELTRMPVFITDDGTEARNFFVGAEALTATPMENVRGGLSGTTFYGVLGRTLLTFELHFAQQQAPRGCMRAYPFLYTLKANDGSLRGQVQRWLVLTPPGMSIGGPGARWCGPVTVPCE